MTGRTLLLIAVVGSLAGCGGPGSFLSRNTTMGSLKTSASQLEFRNEQLEKQVAELKTENRRFEERLVQEEAETGDLAARLDDARNLLGERAGDIRTGSRSKSDTGDDVSDDPPAPRARRSTRSTRKPPAAAIPGRIEPIREPNGGDVGLTDPPARGRMVARRPTRDERWLPVARGLGVSQPALK